MIVGNQGISKSISFLLAWYLSNISTNIRFKCPSIIQTLAKKKLLNASFMKIIYISFPKTLKKH
jgi:hypothetical protein